MNVKKEIKTFIYEWSYEDVENSPGTYNTVIRAYGLAEGKNPGDVDNVYIRIEGFTPFCYLELPTIIQGRKIQWNQQNIQKLTSKLEFMNQPKVRPLTKQFQMKNKLYMNQKEKKDGKYSEKEFPFLLLTFSSMKAMGSFCRSLGRELNIIGLGRHKFRVFENDPGATPVIKLLALRKIPSAGWIKVTGVEPKEKESFCDIEIVCDFRKIDKISEEEIKKLPKLFPKVLSFDIEAYSSKWKNDGFPNPEFPDDVAFQIGIVISRNSKYSSNNKYKKILLTVGAGYNRYETNKERQGKTKDVGKSKFLGDIKTMSFESEKELILEFTKIVQEERPNVIIGYNIFGFDFSFLLKRTNKNNRDKQLFKDRFARFGFLKDRRDGIEEDEEAKGLESKAYGRNKKPIKLNSEGILYIDLLLYVRFGWKLTNYKLSTVAEYFKVGLKDPLTPQDIFEKYELSTIDSLGEVGKYCVQDSFITLLLYEKLNTWLGLTEEAKTNHVPIIYLHTRGQQIKMFSGAYEYCLHRNRVVQTGVYEAKDNEKYQGAIVLPPEEGLHHEVVSEDFSSLYPSIIISHNIDYTTLVDENDDSIPDEDCHVFEWEEHVNCEHDFEFLEKEKKKQEREKKRLINKKNRENKKFSYIVFCDEEEKEIFSNKEIIQNKLDEKDILKNVKLDLDDDKKDSKEESKKPKKKVCGKFKFKWLKHEVSGKGVIPDIIEGLLAARKKTRAELKTLTEKVEKLSKEYEKSTLSKKELKELKEEIENLEVECIVLEKRQLSYKVSANSMYGAMGVKKGYLPFLPGAMSVTYKGRISIGRAIKLIEEDFGGKVLYGDTDSCMCTFPRTKEIKDEKERIKELVRIGVEISKKSQTIYPPPMKLEFENKLYWQFLILSKKRYITQVCDVTGKIYQDLNIKGIALQRRDFSTFLKDVMKKLVDMIFEKRELDYILNVLVEYINKLFQRGYSYEDFVITKSLTREPNEFKSKPAHAFLVENMRKRGQQVDVGARIGYVLTTKDRYLPGIGKNVKQCDKIEDEDYFNLNREVLRIDFLYYLEKQGTKPIDEILNKTFGEKVMKKVEKKAKKTKNPKKKSFEENKEVKTNLKEEPKFIGFMKYQYNLRKAKQEICRQIENFASAKITFDYGERLNMD